MNKICLVPIILSLLGSLCVAFAQKEEEVNRPIAIEAAIEKAREYVRDHKVDVSGRHISSAEILRQENSSNELFWFIIWEPDSNLSDDIVTLGGQVFARVYSEGRVVITYGE